MVDVRPIQNEYLLLSNKVNVEHILNAEQLKNAWAIRVLECSTSITDGGASCHPTQIYLRSVQRA